MITNCCIPQSEGLDLPGTPKLACCCGDRKSPSFIRKQQQPSKLNPNISVCDQHVFTVKRPVLQVCIHTRKSVKPHRI